MNWNTLWLARYIAGADLYCIVDACSVDGWVFVEKVTWVNQSGDCWEFHCPNSQNGWDATLHWKVRQNGALTSILGSIISWHLFLSWLRSVEWRWSKKRADLFSHQYLIFFSSNRWIQFWILSFDKFSVLTTIPILARLKNVEWRWSKICIWFEVAFFPSNRYLQF